MDFVYFNKRNKGLSYAFLVFLVLGMISFKIADSISFKYQIVRDNFLNQINDKNLSNKDIKRIANDLQSINKKFHTSESVAIYVKKKGINNGLDYFNLDFRDVEYLFPINAVKKDNLITDAFRVGEGLDAGKYYVVHYYYPDWFFLIPTAMFTVSGILFILWIICLIKYAYTTRSKLKIS